MNQKRNFTGMMTVVLLHVALLVAFLQGSKLSIFKAAPPVIDLVPTLELPKPKERDPQVEEPPMRQPDVIIPKPIEDFPVEQPPTITGRVVENPPATLPPARTGGVAEPGEKTSPARPAPLITAAVVDAQACSKPDYPKNALRNGDTGTVMLAFLIGTDGKVAEARVEKSSGFRELDRAAQAGLSLCKFKPGSVDGVAQPSWTKMQYVWSLDN
jgi:protein TonB